MNDNKHWNLHNLKRSSDFLQNLSFWVPQDESMYFVVVISFQVNFFFNSAQSVTFSSQLFNICMHPFICDSHHAIVQYPTNCVYSHYLEDSPKVFVLHLI